MTTSIVLCWILKLFWGLDKSRGENPRELSGRDITYYMQGSGFEPQTSHFPTIKLCKL